MGAIALPLGEISCTTAGPRGVAPGTTARRLELLSSEKFTFTPAIVSDQPARLAGKPDAAITAVPPVGTPGRPVATLRTGTRRLICWAAAGLICKPAVSVTACTPVSAVTVTKPGVAPGLIEIFSSAFPGATIQIRRTEIGRAH